MSKKVIEYCLVERMDGSGWKEILSSDINDLIKKGWQPFGSPSQTLFSEPKAGTYLNYVQAMVKYEDDK